VFILSLLLPLYVVNKDSQKPFDREYLENVKSERYMLIRA